MNQKVVLRGGKSIIRDKTIYVAQGKRGNECMVRLREDPYYTCTRDAYHTGDHAVHGICGEMFARWPQ